VVGVVDEGVVAFPGAETGRVSQEVVHDGSIAMSDGDGGLKVRFYSTERGRSDQEFVYNCPVWASGPTDDNADEIMAPLAAASTIIQSAGRLRRQMRHRG
jgi:hypothetical protein